MIEQGDRAPGFELPDQDGNLVELRGKPVVAYFYPEASTPASKISVSCCQPSKSLA